MERLATLAVDQETVQSISTPLHHPGAVCRYAVVGKLYWIDASKRMSVLECAVAGEFSPQSADKKVVAPGSHVYDAYSVCTILVPASMHLRQDDPI